jgi:hypothetical protein
MTTYRIFPALGIARLGADGDFIVGPEIPGQGPGELRPDSTLGSVTHFKDATRTKIRKQGARFHLFESENGIDWQPAKLPAGATVTWAVTLENKKSAVKRNGEPPVSPTRPQVAADLQSMLIKGGTQEVSGANQTSNPFKGPFATTAPNGQPFNVEVELGQLRTDAQGRLIVLGGKGFSSAPPNVPIGGPGGTTFYKNPKWHDDVADGPVTAEIRLAPTSAPIQAEGGAWVIVAPPDYAPGIDGVVTLYDVLRQLGLVHFGLPQPGVPSFDLDIAPLLTRVRRLRWVHDDAAWSNLIFDNPNLRSRAAADKSVRDTARNMVEHVEDVLQGHINPQGPPFRLRAFQRKVLDNWVNGDFDDKASQPDTGLTAAGLTRAALEGAVGQGFCPGIEAGIIMLDTTLYVREPFDFRIDHTSVAAGDLTALMAQPWQADFLKCNTEWWPTQRPDLAPQSTGPPKDWIRGVHGHRELVERSARLGFVVQQGMNEVFLEVERDPELPET